MSGDRRWGKKAKIPDGWEIIAPTMDALDQEMKDRIAESHDGKRKVEIQWPVHQLNWQRTRYVFDMYVRYKRIGKDVYDYCVKQKLIDVNLVAKWKKQGYERLCSAHAINPKNSNFGTVSICRVPRYELGPDHPMVENKMTGCRGCSTGRGGRRNIFGNKYGQYLAAIQVDRERRVAKGEDVDAGSVWAASEAEAKFDNAEADDSDEDEEQNARRKRRRRMVVADGTGAQDLEDEALQDKDLAARLAALKQQHQAAAE
eukprot:TRINITY_DN11974_c0_g1_i1.p1 TRINITY_DN11974_c0_g1~~TRINITY_DN11974_c0_g1_i1.p1  ORF type:complete len:275 (+),score=133.46 TRINITY_DN11974_c0_g1_i1:54-827(+)